jgi:phospholipid/cholesterol/gamma-HCH transport system substrate-binding protein
LSAEILLDDLRAHPKRYVNISVFGRKDKDGASNFAIEKRHIDKGQYSC